MTDYQEQKYKRNGILLDLFNRHATDVNLNPKFKIKVGLFGDIHEKINVVYPMQEIDNTGITIGKNATRKDIGYLGLGICGALCSLADDISDSDLYQRMNLTISSFTNGSVSKFKKLCSGVVTEARNHVTKLPEYGILVTSIDKFDTLSQGFHEIANEPRNAAIKKSVATINLAKLLADANLLMKKHFDKLILQYVDSSPDFYNGYWSARILEDRGSKKKKTTPPKALPQTA